MLLIPRGHSSSPQATVRPVDHQSMPGHESHMHQALEYTSRGQAEEARSADLDFGVSNQASHLTLYAPPALGRRAEGNLESVSWLLVGASGETFSKAVTCPR